MEEEFGLEEEFQEIDERNGWPMSFAKIRLTAAEYEYSIRDAKRTDNKPRNRYRDVSPYDHTRIRLKRGNNDYINASLVQSPQTKRSYILTQGPLPTTSGHFWLMVWEQNTKAVVMLNKVIEKGSVKCAQYWPLGDDHNDEGILTFKDEQIRVALLDEDIKSYYTVRTLELEDMVTGETREVYHFHYTTWPDFGLPQSPSAFLNFLAAVRESGSLDDDVGPAVVHCSAGIGRSGMFCLADTCLLMVEKSGDMNSIDITSILLDMRRYRMGLIQTPDQLRFSYLAIIEGAKRILKTNKLDSPTDEDVDGIDQIIGDIPPSIPPKKSRSQEFSDQKNVTGNSPGKTESRETEEAEDTKEEEQIEEKIIPKPTEEDDTRHREQELRKRKRLEKKHSMEERLAKMRKKQRESESWKKQRPLEQKRRKSSSGNHKASPSKL
ncbi:tyrosine-protein phosphatase non-receptor type 2-like isoform X2 [Ptychodera flava]|uniref:tyrosine-protein phosphatase non-receptor type 2-like isoform X2 n=1 Tax=Ptychodera flava TaxID=63121 RepID=UPI00396A6264